MKKPYPFNKISLSVVCCEPGCNKPIKLNVLDRKNLLDKSGKITGLRCNSCHHKYEAGRDHFMGKFGHPRTKLLERGLV